MRPTHAFLAIQVTAAASLIAASWVAPPPAFYGVVVAMVGVGAWELLGMTHPRDSAGRTLGTLLAVGHSATIWFFEGNLHVLLPAQSLLPLNALLFTLLRSKEVDSFAQRAMGVAFAPLWAGLLTYLAIARRADAVQGKSFAILVVALAFAAQLGGGLRQGMGEQPARGAVEPWPALLDLCGASVATSGVALALELLLPAGVPLVHLLGLALAAAFLARVGWLGQALLERSLNATPRWRFLRHSSAVLLISPLVYGYLQARPWLPS